jgi:hypothetical protein
MAKPWKTDLFATAEDDIRQFGAALFGLFRAAPRAACERWPGANITLRAGATVIEHTRRVRTGSA